MKFFNVFINISVKEGLGGVHLCMYMYGNT